jgi:N-acetylneuraminic acid mutarotase
VEEYDPTTDTWTKKDDMPTARAGCSGAVINGKMYVIGGGTIDPNNPGSFLDALSTVEEYTPEGWPFNIIFPQNNLPSTWGKQKQER